MGSGESDVRLLRGGLDAWTRCQGPGCRYDVPLPASLCPAHGGPGGPMRWSDAFGHTSYTVVYSSGDAEPEDGYQPDPAA